MTYLRSSNMPAFPSPERSAACSLPIALTRPSRHSSRYGLCGARRRATFSGDFRHRGDTRPPPPVPWRSTSPPEPTIQGWAETGFAKPGRPETARTTGCVAFPDTARLTGTRAVSRNPIAVQGEAKMNKNDLVSHVAAETSATRATAERTVGAVFSAIGDALARDEPVAIAGFGKFDIRGRAARRGRNPKTGEPVAIAASRVPSFKAAKALRDAVNG